MKTLTRAVAVVDLALLPALLFLAAVVVRSALPAQGAVATTSAAFVNFYAGRMWTLWLLLLALPLIAFVIGLATVVAGRPTGVAAEVQPPAAAPRGPTVSRIVAGETLVAAGILMIVVLHMMAD